MTLARTLAATLVLSVAAPVFANTTITLDFEAASSFASVGALDAAQGVRWTDPALALANDALGPYFLNGNTPGSSDPLAGTVMFISGAEPGATLNLAAGGGLQGITGFVGRVAFDFASTADGLNLVQVFAGPDGSGQRLAKISLSENQLDSGCTGSAFCHWQTVTMTFSGTAQSLVFSSNGGNIAYDNISLSAVPEPQTAVLLLAGLLGLGFVARRQRNCRCVPVNRCPANRDGETPTSPPPR